MIRDVVVYDHRVLRLIAMRHRRERGGGENKKKALTI